ncbi:MAG: aminoacyl-tRNA hydrolase [Gammaproteobacteria bacterium]
MSIKLIVGLGNPGQQYCETRHNVGFWFLEELAFRHGVGWVDDSRFVGKIAEIRFDGVRALLLKPQTFMNRSGQSVGNLLRYYKIAPEETVVVHDELDLPLGIVKLKKSGGHAGHNGVRDIIAQLGSNEFYRLRVGVGRPPSGQSVVNYVLSAPSREDREIIFTAFENVYKNVDLLVLGQFERLMGCLR